MSALRPFDTLLARTREAHRSSDDRKDERNAGDGGAWSDLRREIARARRFTRPFTIIRIERHGLADGWLAYARAVGESIRSIDAMWEADDAVYLLLPESDRSAGVQLVERLRRAMPELVRPRCVGIASFPDDGLTSGALLSHLAGEGRLGLVPRLEAVPAPPSFDTPVAHAQSG